MRSKSVFLAIGFILCSCACRSRPIGNEVETKLPPKKTAYSLRPELKRFDKKSPNPTFDYLLQHSIPQREIESRCLQLRKQLDSSFVIESIGPFVMVTNLRSEELDELKDFTIKASFNALYRDYFDTIPDKIYTLYIFKDHADYLNYSRKLLDESPTTPYGYYRYDKAAVVVNYSSGRGTLVHEMIHALLDIDFPAAPTWFNEGFASLFEQSELSEGRICGLYNWRFDILKEAIVSNNTIRLKQLLGTTTEEFYDDKDGRKYAEARFVCYFLQEAGLLKKFYEEFRKNVANDPTGEATLQAVTGKTLEELEKEIFSSVLKRNYVDR
ncbi:MAG: hypothetical protein RMM17_12225 [Acidobacteriota bacterium]|nr:hypothetical protein [Blastocatellia bacterium]MDW8413436.1 hypothetical protein [Acidobacteriota bacterium]